MALPTIDTLDPTTSTTPLPPAPLPPSPPLPESLQTQFGTHQILPPDLKKWNFDEVQQKCYQVHADDLVNVRNTTQSTSVWSNTPLIWARESSAVALMRSIYVTVGQIFFALASNPFAAFQSPLGWSYSVWLYSATFSLLILYQIGLTFFTLFHGDKIVNLLQTFTNGNKWPKQLSTVNMAMPEMFRNVSTIVRAREVLGRPMRYPAQTDQEKYERTLRKIDGKRIKYFDIDVARALLLMSAILYERDNLWVQRAADYKNWAVELLCKSEEIILQAAKFWNVRYVSASDCVSIGGCFAGIFYSAQDAPEDPWIVVAFKGTSPDSFKEFLIDATFAHDDATDYLWGSLHQGFYSTLFPANGTQLPVSPYRRIQLTMNAVAHHLQKERASKKPVNVFVTGHSLGAGLSSLFYARLLAEQTAIEKAPAHRDHDEQHIIMLRDCYTFGAPNVGSGSFAAGFEKLMHEPKNELRTFWRVSNGCDIVARIPPGVADNRSNRINLREDSLLNFSHIGIGIQLHAKAGHAPYPSTQRWTTMPGTEIHYVEHDEKSIHHASFFFGEKRLWWHPIQLLVSIAEVFAPFLAHHAPTSYWLSLAKVSGDKRPFPHDDAKFKHLNDDDQKIFEEEEGPQEEKKSKVEEKVEDKTAKGTFGKKKGNATTAPTSPN